MSARSWEDAIMKFLLKKVSDCTEYLCITTLCKDFNIEYPKHAAPSNTIYKRIRSVLKHIDHKVYDDTILARLMFYLAQPLIGNDLKEVEKRLQMSGKLCLDDRRRIILYENDEVHFEAVHTAKTKQTLLLREERARRESEARKRERMVGDEAREMEAGLSRQEADIDIGSIEEEYDPMEDEYVEMEDEPVASSSTRPPAPKRVRVEEPIRGIGQYERPENSVRIQLPEIQTGFFQAASNLTACSVPVQPELRNQTETFSYSSFLKYTHNYIFVLDDPIFESLSSEIVEELEKPETSELKIPGTQITEALAYGIRIVVNHAKQNVEPSSKPIRLIETLRLWNLLLLQVGFPQDDENVTKIRSFINKSSPEMMIPLAKLRFALESVFEKIRQ